MKEIFFSIGCDCLTEKPFTLLNKKRKAGDGCLQRQKIMHKVFNHACLLLGMSRLLQGKHVVATDRLMFVKID